ncbi:MAG: hypothetical protein ACOY0T_12870 [Myxococcota bacterium]
MTGISELLDALEPMTHRDRSRRMVELGREAAGGDASAAELLEGLWALGMYERTLALQAVYGGRGDARALTRVVEAATGSSRTLRFRAMRLVANVCDDEGVATVLAGVASRAARGRLLAMLQRKGRVSAVARFLEGAGGLEDPRNVDLLPLSSRELLVRELPRFREHASAVGWTRLAKHHAEVLAAEVEVALERTLDVRARVRLIPTLALAARRAPVPVLAAAARLARAGEHVPVAAWNELIRQLPRETFDVLRERNERAPVRQASPGAFAGIRLARVAHRLGAERLAYATRHAYQTLPEGRRGRRWFLRLTPDDREAALDSWAQSNYVGAWGGFLLRHMPVDAPERRRAFERWVAAARDKRGVVAVSKLVDLPHDLRHEEAERHLSEIPELAGKSERLEWAALLPFERAREQMSSFLGHPEGEFRALALNALTRTLDGDRGSVDALLEYLKARRFEQDPVRLAALRGLAEQPWACFPERTLQAAGAVIEHALAASDLSSATAAYLERWVVRLFRVDPLWGAERLAELVRVRGNISQLGLGEGLLPSDLARFEPAFKSLITRWATQERAGSLLWLAQSLGPRLEHSDSLLSALERLASELPFVGVAATALTLLRRAAPARFGDLVPRLLAEDASFVALPSVANHVSCQRQDLLAPLLAAPAPMRGRFASGRTHWVLDFPRGVATWTARCQQTWAAQLEKLAAEPDRDVPTLRFAIDRTATLAFADASNLLRFLSDARQPVREIAIDAAARLDAAQGLSALIDCLADDRARWAIYALRSVFAELTPHDVIVRLRSVPRKQVTVAKEVVRLLGELGGDEAFAEILTFDMPQTKRDVRIAMLRALWNHLHRPEAWSAFERAAADSDWVVASRIADVPIDRLSQHAETRLATLLATVLDRPEAELRLDLLNRAPYLPLRDTERRFLQAILRRIGAKSPDEARAATWAALHRLRSDDDDELELLLAEVRAVINRRETAHSVLEALRPQPYGPAWRRQLALSVLTELTLRPECVVPRLEFAGYVLDVRALARLFASTHESGLLHFDAFRAACGAVDRCTSPSALEELLRHAEPEELRRLALQALLAAAHARGWDRERRELLAAYRADPSILVSTAAQWVFPPAVRERR